MCWRRERARVADRAKRGARANGRMRHTGKERVSVCRVCVRGRECTEIV